MILGINGSKVKLTKIKSNHSILRTNDVIGIVYSLPIVGSRFAMKAASLDKTKGIRWVETSEILSVDLQEDDSWKIITRNSEYRLEVLRY